MAKYKHPNFQGSMNAVKHGRYSKATVEFKRKLREEIKRLDEIISSVGIPSKEKPRGGA
jgi:hypothetical protein